VPGRRRFAIAALLVAALALAFNLATAARDLVDGDGAELQALAIVGGIPHPSGYPTWALLARAFGAAWPGPAAARATALSAVCGGAALGALVLLLGDLGIGVGAAVAAALLYGAGFTFRLASIRPEVYTLAVLVFVVAFRAVLRAAPSGRLRDHAIAAALMGLAITAHFSMAPAVAVLGAWLVFRAAPLGRARRLLALALGSAAGLLPYLYLVTQDTPGQPMNYLATTIELGARQFGLTAATFARPWQRIGWLVLGHETRPTLFLLHPRQLVFNLESLAAHALLFDPGALLVAAAGAGLVVTWRRDRVRAALLAAIVAVSIAFAAVLTYGKLLPIFSLPATLVLAILAACAIDAVGRSTPLAAAALVVALVVGVIAAQALRVRAQTTPIGPHRWHVEEKPPRIRSLLPRLDGYDEARRYGAEATRALPESALVVGRWNEIAILRYLREVEGTRRDLTLDAYYPEHRSRLERWARAHDPRTHPFVFLSRWPDLESSLAATESLEIRPGRWMWVRRAPLGPAIPAP
jgi:hypothetical protein